MCPLRTWSGKFSRLLTAMSLFTVLLISVATVGNCQGSSYDPDKIIKRNALESKGRKLAESGYLDEAIEMYLTAMKPEYLNYWYDSATAEGALREIYKWKGDYDKSLMIAKKRLDGHPEIKANVFEVHEIKALIQYKSTNDPTAVRSFIGDILREYSDWLPPKGYNSYSAILISDILRLYDTIGDYDAGIKFIDESLAYFRTGKAGDPKLGRVDAEFMKVREAFVKDKADGTKGRATKVLIQSDYFPW